MQLVCLVSRGMLVVGRASCVARGGSFQVVHGIKDREASPSRARLRSLRLLSTSRRRMSRPPLCLFVERNILLYRCGGSQGRTTKSAQLTEASLFAVVACPASYVIRSDAPAQTPGVQHPDVSAGRHLRGAFIPATLVRFASGVWHGLTPIKIVGRSSVVS